MSNQMATIPLVTFQIVFTMFLLLWGYHAHAVDTNRKPSSPYLYAGIEKEVKIV